MTSHLKMMSEIKRVTDEAIAGSKKIRITFKDTKEATSGIEYLLAMVDHKIVLMEEDEEMKINSASHARNFNVTGRTFVLSPGEAFSDQWFAKRMCNVIDSIEVVVPGSLALVPS